MQVVWGGSQAPVLRERMKEWAARNIWPGASRHFGNCVCMGVMDGSEPVACMVYHNWEPEAGVIEISGAAASRRWLTRAVLSAMFNYPFLDLKAQLVVMRVAASSEQKHLHRMLKSYGFKSNRIERLGGRGVDILVFTLTDDAWRASRFNKGRNI